MGQKIHSVEKAIQILYLFSHQKAVWGISEIAQTLDMHKSTVFRLIDTMVDNGLLRKTQDKQKYRLGLKLFELGGVVFDEFHLKDIANTYIHALSDECGETVHMGILNEMSVMSIETADTKNSLKPAILIGKSSPIHCTGIGKAILAFLDESKQCNLLTKITLTKFTDKTITLMPVLKGELEKIRKRGYAIDDMEHELGIRCIAAPVFDHTNEVIASLSISGPSIRITPEKIDGFSALLIDTCKNISADLGYIEGRV